MKQHLWIGLTALAAVLGGCISKPKPVATNPYHPVPIYSFATAGGTNIGLNGHIAKEMYVFDKLVIVYDDANLAHVINRETGELIAIDELPDHGGTIHDPSVVGDWIIYPATTRVKVYSTKSNLLIKDFQVPFAIRTACVGTGTTLFMGADHPNGGRLEALDLSHDPVIPPVWEVFTGASISAAPAMSKKLVFFAAEDGFVRAVSEDRGGAWSLSDSPDGAFKAGPRVSADLKSDEQSVYIPSIDTKLYALNNQTGKIRWQYYAGAPLQNSPTITSDSLYILVPRRGLVALNKGDDPAHYNRQARWSNATAVKFLADDAKFSYVEYASGHIAALDKLTGQQKFVSTRNDMRLFGTNSKDSTIYAIDPRGFLLQIKPVVREGFVGEVVMNDTSDSLGQ